MSQHLVDLSILVPIYNEEENIKLLLDEIESALALSPYKYEVIAVDDGSTDRSSEVLQELAKSRSYLKVILMRKNYGQTAAFDAGFRCVRGQTVATMDADLQNDPKDLIKMLRLLNSGFDFVAGWRKKRKDGFFLRTFPSKLANKFIRFVTKTKLHDLGCSLKVYRKEITDDLFLYGEMHRFIGVMVEGLGAKTTELEVNHRSRIHGQSKYGLKRTVKVLLDLITIWFLEGYFTKPIYVFGGAGFLLIFFSTPLFAYVLYEKFFARVYVHNNPWFIIGIFFSLVGVQLIALGLLAEVAVRNHFESTSRRPYGIRKKIGFE